MKFICLGYAEESAWDGMSKRAQEAMMEECFAYDDVLRAKGHTWGGGEALQNSRTAKTLRWQAGKVVVTDGPYAETKEQLGGFGVLEANDIDHAVELVSEHPGLRYGPFEIRPADEPGGALSPSAAVEPGATPGARRFVSLGYINEKSPMTKSELDALLKECGRYDDILRKNGHWVVGEGLQGSATAKTLRSKGGKVVVTDGPFAETKEQLAGAVVLLARDINHIVELMSNHPALRHGVAIELRPVDEEVNALIAARENRFKQEATR